jgi:hypothetical protein
MMLITDHQCQVAGHAPGSGGPGNRAGRAGTQAGPSETRTARHPAVSTTTPSPITDSLAPGRGTGSPWHGPPRLAAESLHCQAGRTRLGLGLRRRPESSMHSICSIFRTSKINVQYMQYFQINNLRAGLRINAQYVQYFQMGFSFRYFCVSHVEIVHHHSFNFGYKLRDRISQHRIHNLARIRYSYSMSFECNFADQ